MRLETVKLSQLKPYKTNPRNNADAIAGVAESISQCTYVSPIVVDENMEILAGHTRLKALKRLKRKVIPVIIVEDLTEEQKRKYRLLDNKTNEAAEWSKDLLALELADLDFEGFDFGFGELLGMELEAEAEATPEEDSGYIGDERERTFNSMNLHDYDPFRTGGKFNMPMIYKETHIPKDLISFNYVLSKDDFEKGVHFYIDDYQFERIWNSPHDYMERLTQFDCCLTPDFSLYTDMPLAMQLWNVYRSRLIGQIMQNYGIKVIPTLSWCRKDSFDFCFDGLEPGGVYSVSTIGCKKEREAIDLWFAGMDEAIKRLNPSAIVVYGGDNGYTFKCKAIYIDNHNAKDFSKRFDESEV